MSLRKLFKSNTDANIESEKVLVPCSNGSSFIQKNKMIFEIPNNHQFVSLRECFVHFDVALLNNTEGCELPKSGAQRLIKSVVIKIKNGKTLETINNYNILATYCSHYALTSGEKNSRSITELGEREQTDNGNNFDTKIICNQFLQSYERGNAPTTDPKKPLKQRVVLKLWSKVFDNYDEDVVYPNVFSPIQVHIELEDNVRALQVIPQLNPTDTSLTCKNAADLGGGNTSDIKIANDRAKGIDANENGMEGHPFSVNGTIQFAEQGLQTNSRVITSCTMDGNVPDRVYKVGFATLNAPQYTTACILSSTTAAIANCTYRITSPNLEVSVCKVPDTWRSSLVDLVSENKFRYNLKAVDNVQVNVQSGATTFNNYINSNAMSVSAVLTIANDSQTSDTRENDLIVGQYNTTGMDSYQYHYQNTNNPSIAVSLLKLQNGQVSQQHLSELMKTNENFWGTKSLHFHKTFFAFGRSFGVHSSAMRLTNKDLSNKVSVKSGTSLQNNQMYNNYLVKNIQLVVSKDGVEVVE